MVKFLFLQPQKQDTYIHYKRVASFAIVQDLGTMFAKVQGFHFFLDFFGGHFFLT